MQLLRSPFTSFRPAEALPQPSLDQGRADWSQRSSGIAISQAGRGGGQRRRRWVVKKKENNVPTIRLSENEQEQLRERLQEVLREQLQEVTQDMLRVNETIVTLVTERLLKHRDAMQKREELVELSCYAAWLTPLFFKGDEEVNGTVVSITVMLAVLIWMRAFNSLVKGGTRPRKRMF